MKKQLVVNQKGGIGKTTLCRQQTFYTHEQGYRVLATDLDPQGNFTRTMLQVRERNGLPPVGEVMTAAHLFMESPPDLPLLWCGDGLALLPSTPELLDIPSLGLEVIGRPRQVLERLESQFDFMIADIGPARLAMMKAILQAVDYVVCPFDIDQDAIDGLHTLMHDIREAQTILGNPTLKMLGGLASRVHRDRVFETRSVEELKQAMGDIIIPPVLYDRAATKYAKDYPVWQSSNGISRSQAATEMRDVCEYLLTRMMEQ